MVGNLERAGVVEIGQIGTKMVVCRPFCDKHRRHTGNSLSFRFQQKTGTGGSRTERQQLEKIAGKTFWKSRRFCYYKEMFEKIFIKKIIENQLGDVPAEQKEKIINAVSENPDFFSKLAEEIKKETDSGKDQISAIMSVMPKYEEELRKMMS